MFIQSLEIFAGGETRTEPAAGKVDAKVEGSIAWRDVSQWGVEGRGWTNGLARFYDRLPARAQQTVPPAVWQYSRECAGMSVRFRTDAASIHVRYRLLSGALSHGWGDTANMNASGMDLYALSQDASAGRMTWRWVGGNKPTAQNAADCLADGLAPGMRMYVLNLPVYNGMEQLEIGVPVGATFVPVAPRQTSPVVFYGTSIMQGGIASRPGLAIPAMIGRRLNRPVLNFGFCGSGLMDLPVVDLLAGLDAAAFVIDCEPNMDAALVSQRTEPLVQRLRQAHPNTPILLVENHDHPAPVLFPKKTDEIKASQAALRTAYDKLVQAGDKNLYYLPGRDLIGTDGEGTGDGIHPNALGMARYSDAYEAALRKILGPSGNNREEADEATPLIPKIVGDFVLIYKPGPDVYDGENTGNYRKGTTYKDWRVNDHTFIKGPDKRWHCLGITRPHDVKNDGVHEGEGTCFHAVAPPGDLEDAFAPEVWKDKPKLNVSGCGWAPVCLKVGDTYSIIGSEKRRAESNDLFTWVDKGPMAIKGGNRDPNVMFWNGTYYFVMCNQNGVSLVTSTNFVNWSDPVEIFKPATASWQCESPTLLHHGNKFYLFWCLWDQAAPGAWTEVFTLNTYVYVSDTPTKFDNRTPVAILKAHAPEIFQDEKGNWFISSAGYPQDGINLARLTWKPQPAPAVGGGSAAKP